MKRKKKKKPAIQTFSEVQITRDGSVMAQRDTISISLRSETESIDSLINKALKAVKNTESNHSNKTEMEWIK